MDKVAINNKPRRQPPRHYRQALLREGKGESAKYTNKQQTRTRTTRCKRGLPKKSWKMDKTKTSWTQQIPTPPLLLFPPWLVCWQQEEQLPPLLPPPPPPSLSPHPATSFQKTCVPSFPSALNADSHDCVQAFPSRSLPRARVVAAARRACFFVRTPMQLIRMRTKHVPKQKQLLIMRSTRLVVIPRSPWLALARGAVARLAPSSASRRI
jgi:hypothetical protein